MEFERAGPDDAKELSVFAHGIMTEYFNAFLPEELVEKVFERFLAPAKIVEEMVTEGFVFEYVTENGKKIGYTATQNNGDSLLISKIYLVKECRGKGYGSKIIKRIADSAVNSGCRKVCLFVNRNNGPSIAMYEKNGFVISDSVDTDIGDGLVMNDYLMELQL